MKHPMVVGYKGEIGSFILNGLLRLMPKALNIWCVDVNETEKETAQRIKASDVIFLCVPLQATIPWILQHKNLLKNKVIIEQCSLKERLFEYDKVKALDVRSMHILFRPSQTPDLADRKVGLFVDQFDRTMQKYIEAITQSEIIFYSNAKEHDMEMATQQALLHRTILIMGKLLRQCNGSTYISKKVLELEARIRKGNLDLYERIQNNKYLFEKQKLMTELFDVFKIEEYWK